MRLSLGRQGTINTSILYVIDELPAETVAAALEHARRLITDVTRFSPDAYALDEEANPVRELAELPSACRLGLIAAIDASTSDLAVQEAACRALRLAADDALIRVSLARVGQRLGHERTLALIDDAIVLARGRDWEALSLRLPDRPPTAAEWHALGFQHQAIELGFFGAERDCATQFEMTWGVVQSRRAELEQFNVYVALHRDAIDVLAQHAERGLGTRARRLAWRLRARASGARRRQRDIVF